MQPEIRSLLNDLAAARVTVTNEDGTLRVRAPKGALTDEIKAQIAAHKPALIALLRHHETDNGQPTLSPDSPHSASTAPNKVELLSAAWSDTSSSLSLNVLTPTKREVLRRISAGDETPCCGVRFTVVGAERICPSCKLHWPDADLAALNELMTPAAKAA